METLIASLAYWITPAYIAWILIPKGYLNKVGASAAHWAESLAWVGFISASACVALFVITGREPITWALGSDAILGIRLDALTTPLLLLVTFLAAIILRFSRNYMGGDSHLGEFVKWISITVGSVLALILAPGLIQFAIAWIATSISLHQLLIFFPSRHGTLFSARKKFLLSRVADLAIIASFIGIYAIYGSQSFDSIFVEMASSQQNLIWVGWLIALAAVLKSAQFPFHTWLPDTMGTPTPVSAIMHAGIINAGGVLLIRFSPLFAETTTALYAVAAIGAITAIFGSFVMLSQTSIKRSLAYSTIAQMGFMLMQCGLGAFHLALLHIVAHSLYKAHTFLSSGSTVQVIDSLSTESKANRDMHIPLFAAIGLSFAVVFSLLFATGSNPSDKPGMIALGVVVALAMSQLLLRQLRRDASLAAFAKVIAVAASIALAYLALAATAAWWMKPLTPSIPLTHVGFEWGLALILFVCLGTTLQLQMGSRFLIPLRIRDALYVHALNGFYANTLANRLLKLIKLQPKGAQ